MSRIPVFVGQHPADKVKLREMIEQVVQLVERNVVELAILQRLNIVSARGLIVKTVERHDSIHLPEKPVGDLDVVYSFCFLENPMLKRTPMRVTPTKKVTHNQVVSALMALCTNRIVPMMALSTPHNTFTMGEDNPRPGGLANGVGNLFPEMPSIK